MKKLLITISFGFLFSLISISANPSTSHACSCAAPPTIEEEFDNATDVFSGEVVRITEQQDSGGFLSKRVLFDVSKVWKGNAQSEVIIKTGIGGGDCGYGFEQGKNYLVYAQPTSMYGSGDELATIICNGTKQLSAAQEDLAFLGEGGVPIENVNLEDELSGEKSLDIRFIETIAIIIFGIGSFLL